LRQIIIKILPVKLVQRAIFLLTVLLLSTKSYTQNDVNSTDSVRLTDTISMPLNDSLLTVKDSLPTDTIPVIKKKNNNAIDFPIDYHAGDSTVFDAKNRKVYLYGDSFIHYKEMELTAGFIEVDLENNLLYAYGVSDSAGNVTLKPHFKENEEEFTADTIRYNVKTKIGKIKNVKTKQGEGYLHMNDSKRQSNGNICMKGGKYTTCDSDHPHFYIYLTKAKVIPNDKIVSGRAYMVIEDIPIPAPQLPFGFFPNNKKQTSGILIPEYGEEDNRGFFLKNGGYYFAISDYMDLQLRGDIYSLGSWAVNNQTRYKRNYRYNGNLLLSYSFLQFGEKDLSEIQGMYNASKMYSIRWSHKQDPKARPNSNFSANVDISSSAYDKFQAYGNNRFNNTKQSSISYSKIFANSPFSFSANLRHSQNNNDSIMNLSLPEMSMNMSRIYPLKKKIRVGKTRFYEKIGVSYTSNFKNMITARQDSLFEQRTLDNMKNGINNSIPVSTSMKFLKNFTFNPSFNYTNRMYFDKLYKSWSDSIYNAEDSVYSSGMVTQTEDGFYMLHDYNFNASLTTKIYGMFTFKSEKIKAIRHVMTPNISYRYQPSFDRYYDTYIYNASGMEKEYSYWENSLYGAPTRYKAQLLTFSLGNNVEMKVKSNSDTVKTDKKITIFENLSASSSYNFLAYEKDSLYLSPIRIEGRTNIKTLNINFGGTIDPYALDEINNKVIPVYEMDQTGKIGRLTEARISAGFTLRSKKTDKDKKKAEQLPADYLDYYVDFDIPWNISFSYSYSYRKPKMEKDIIQTLNITGDINITPKWKVSASSGYNFVDGEFSSTTITIHRDLHCWEMRFNWVPFGFYRSYNFQISAKSSMLQDLKLNRRRSWMENF